MKQGASFRKASKEDCRRIAELFCVASDGVADYVWSTMAEAGESLLDVGTRRYAREDIPFSYRNCVVAERDGEVIGMLVAFPMPEQVATEEEDTAKPAARPGAERRGEPDVLAPYRELEAPGSYYICGVAVLPEHRGQGLGSRFLSIARAQAREQGLPTLSLLVFARNERAVRLYERNGFRVVDRRRVVPHELIRRTGDVLLMTAPV